MSSILEKKAKENHPCITKPGEKMIDPGSSTNTYSMTRMNGLQNRINNELKDKYQQQYTDILQRDKTLHFMNLGDVNQFPKTEQGNQLLLSKAAEGNRKYIDFLQSQHKSIDSMTEDELAGFFKYKGLIDEYLKTASPLEKAHCDLTQMISDSQGWSDLRSGLGLAAFAVGGALGCVFGLTGIGAVACAGGIGAAATAIDVNAQYEELSKIKKLHVAGAVSDEELAAAESSLTMALAMVPVGSLAGAGIGRAFQAIPVSKLSAPARRAYDRMRGNINSNRNPAPTSGEWEQVGKLRLGTTIERDAIPVRLISSLGRLKNEAHLSDADAEGIITAYLAAGKSERDEILEVIAKRRESIKANPNFVCE